MDVAALGRVELNDGNLIGAPTSLTQLSPTAQTLISVLPLPLQARVSLLTPRYTTAWEVVRPPVGCVTCLFTSCPWEKSSRLVEKVCVCVPEYVCGSLTLVIHGASLVRHFC